MADGMLNGRLATDFEQAAIERDERRAAAHRHTAAALIRCMDFRDEAAARALVTRLAARGELDGVVPWVWRLEAERAACARVWRASPGWRLTRHAPGRAA